jgi:hypothetical protein
MSNISVDTSGPVWVITAVASGGNALPYTLCPYDLIPKRLHWTSKTAVAGDQVIIESQPPGGSTPAVYQEVASGADFDAVEQTPRGMKWLGPIVITQFDSGVLQIDLV